MNVLVTGATGRIGSIVVKDLREKNYEVRALVLPNDPNEKAIKDLKKKHLAELGVCPKFFIERIYISIDCVDMNDGKERQRLHQAIDEAINEAARRIYQRSHHHLF